MKCPHCNGTGELDSTVGALIREARKAKGLTLADLGERVGVHGNNLQRLEAGRCSPTLTTLTAIASALGVATKDLVP